MADEKQAGGRFQPGKSGNPKGRPRKDAAPLERRDGWSNTASGHGTTRDRRLLTRYGVDVVTDLEARQLWRSEWICKRIIEVIPGEANRRGWALKTDDKEKAEAIQGRAEEICLDHAMTRAAEYERAYGGAAIFPVIEGAQDKNNTPLNEASVAKVLALHVLEPQELWPASYYRELSHPKFGQPETFYVKPLTSGRTGTVVMEIVHESRLVIFGGKRVSRQTQPGQREGWGDSELNHAREMIADAGLTWGSVATLLHEFGQGVYSIDGLAEMMKDAKGPEMLARRMDAMDLFKSTLRSTVVDGKDSYTRMSTPASGLDGLLVQQMNWIAAIAGMPVEILFGREPSGLNSTGDMTIRNWYAQIEKIDAVHYNPKREQLVRLLMLETTGAYGGTEPEVWGVEPKPLWSPSEKEIADTRKVVADTDNIYYSMGLPAESILKDRFGGDTYSMETTFDTEAFTAQREADQAAASDAEAAMTDLDQPSTELAAAGTENVQQTVLNGAQVSSMVEVITAAVGGAIPRESAIQIMQVAFGVSAQQANALLGPKGFEAAKPEPAPNPFGAPPAKQPDQAKPDDTEADDERADGYAAELIEMLGGKCVACQTTERLEIDHIEGRDWDPSSLSQNQRAAKYRAEYESGVKMQVLCRSCNASDGAANKQKSRGPKREES